MDKQRWKELFALLDEGGDGRLLAVREKALYFAANLPDDVDPSIACDLRRVVRLVDEELTARALFAVDQR